MRTIRFLAFVLTLTLCTSALAQPSSPGVEPNIGIWKWGKSSPPPPSDEEEVVSEKPEAAQTSLERLKSERGIEDTKPAQEDDQFILMSWLHRLWDFLWGKESDSQDSE